MRSTLFTIAVLGGFLISGDAAVYAEPSAGSTTTVPEAPIGHLQPHAPQFSPRVPAEQAAQQQMSIFDAQQQKMDEELDKRLNICRC
jgi:hypothetical protein